MKTIKLLCVAATFAIASSAFAIPFLSSGSGKVIHFIRVITPKNKILYLSSLSFYASSKTKNPCGNLNLIKRIVSDPPTHVIKAQTGTHALYASDLTKLDPSMTITCVREDGDYKGTTYSTGPMTVVSKDGKYIRTIPFSETIRFH